MSAGKDIFVDTAFARGLPHEYETLHPVLHARRAGSADGRRRRGRRGALGRRLGVRPPPLHHAGRTAADAHRVRLAGYEGLHLGRYFERIRAIRRIRVHTLSERKAGKHPLLLSGAGGESVGARLQAPACGGQGGGDAHAAAERPRAAAEQPQRLLATAGAGAAGERTGTGTRNLPPDRRRGGNRAEGVGAGQHGRPPQGLSGQRFADILHSHCPPRLPDQERRHRAGAHPGGRVLLAPERRGTALSLCGRRHP